MNHEGRIRFNLPQPVGKELAYLEDATHRGHTSMSGPYSQKVSELLTRELNASDVILTTSCTDALELSAMLLDIKPGDVVVVPSFTFVSTALAFVRAGATLRFCDIEPEGLGLDPNHAAELLDERVRAVVPVHYAGIGCRITELLEVAAPWSRIEIVEDNAHGLYGRCDGRLLGSFGRMATLSFHETKNFVCGEGGALVLNDPADIERAHILRDKGTNRRAFMHGTVDKYTWVDTGSSFGMSDLLAAYLLAQLEAKDHILTERKRVTDTYRRLLSGVVEEHGVTVPEIPAGRESAYHMFYLLMESRTQRDFVLTELLERGIQTTFHYVPLHESAAGMRVAEGEQSCPVTTNISGRLLRLPFYNTLSQSEISRVAAELQSVLRSFDSRSVVAAGA